MLHHSLALLGVVFLFATTVNAQTFTLSTPANLDVPGAADGGFAWDDYDGNGLLDVAVARSGPNQVLIILQTAPNTFSVNQTITVGGSQGRQVAAGDFDNDGDRDILITTGGGDNLLVYANDGSGTFSLWQSGGASVGGREQFDQSSTELGGWADVNGDGWLDMIIDDNNEIDLYLNDGAGELQDNSVAAGFARGAGGYGDYGAVVDFDDDGDVDFYARRDGTASNPAQADIYENDGTGVFTPFYGLNFDASNSNKGAAAWGDLDNDGDFDVVITDFSTTNNATIIVEQTGIGSGTFAVATVTVVDNGGGLSALPNSGDIDGVTLGDVNHDGRVDVFLSANSGTSHLLLNTSSGSGNFSFSSDNLGINVGANGEGCEFIDYDMDGDLDLYIAINGGPNQLWVNNFSNSNYFMLEALFDNTVVGGTGTRPALGATIVILNCQDSVLSGIREINGASGHGTQAMFPAYIGLPTTLAPSDFIRVKISFPSDGVNPRTIIYKNIVPSTLPSQTLTVLHTDSSDAADFTSFTFVVDTPSTPGVSDGSIILQDLLPNTNYDLEYIAPGPSPFGPSPITTNASGEYTIPGISTGTYTDMRVTFAADPACFTTPSQVVIVPRPLAPVAVDDASATDADVATTVDVLTNDNSANSNLAITAVGSALGANDGASVQGGTVSFNDNGTPADSTDDFVDYVPPVGFVGTDTFFYVITDNSTQSDTAQVVVTVNNLPPTAADDAGSTQSGTPISVDVLTNDSDGQSDIEITDTGSDTTTPGDGSTAQGGSVSINDNGTPGDVTDDFIDYTTPGGAYVGNDTFYYVITDAGGLTDTAEVVISVAPAPEACNDGIDNDGDGLIDAFDPDCPGCPPILASGGSTALLTNADVTWDITGSGGPGSAVLNNIVVTGRPFPFSLIIQPDSVVNTLTVGGTKQTVDDGTVQATIFDGPAIFNPAVGDAYSDANLNHYLQLDATSDSTEYIDLFYDDPIFAADDRYLVATERGGNNTLQIRALDASGNPIGTPVTINASGADYIDNLGVTNDNGQDVEAGVFPLSALVPAGQTFFGIRYVPNPSGGSADGGDGKVFILADPLTLSNPSIGSIDTVQATCSDPLGSITVNAVTNTGDVLEYSVNGSTGPFQTSNVFNNLPVGPYSVVVRLQNKPTCLDSTSTIIPAATGCNTPPLAVDDTETTPSNTPVAVDVLTNDSDAESNILITAAGSAAGANDLVSTQGGTLVINDNGTPADSTDDVIDYTPPVGFVGNDTFYYVITDAGGLTDTSFVVVSVINNPPNAEDDAVITNEDVPVDIDVLVNDSDLDGALDTAGLTIRTPPTNGTASTNPDGTITYSPDPDYIGPDALTYIICDLGGLCDTALVSIDVLPVTDTTTVTIPEDSVYTLCTDSVTNLPAPIDNQLLCGSPDDGTIAGVFNPCLTYTPDADFFGTDSFCVVTCAGTTCDTTIVIVTVDPVNDPPVANDDAATTPEDTPITIDLTANDTDIDGSIDDATAALVTPPVNGTVTINPDGTADYVPAPDFLGTDVFTYTVCDDGFPLPALCDTATVTITVEPASPDTTSLTTPEDTPVTLCLDTVTNLPGPVTSTSICGNPDDGTLTTTSIPCVTYTPDPDFFGNDTACVISCSGSICDTSIIVITVTPVNDPPVAVDDLATTGEESPVTVDVLTNDSDLDGSLDTASVAVVTSPTNGTASVNPDGTIDYVPGPDFVGTDVFTYTICDDGFPLPALCDTATVTITVNPTADTVTVTTPEEDPILVCTDSTTSLPGPITTQLICGIPSDGSLSLPFTPCVEYTPDPDFNGNDTLCIVSCSGAICDTIVLVITVTPVNDPPLAIDDNATTDEDTPVDIGVLANDSDIDGTLDTSSVAIVVPPVDGTVSVNPDGSITFTPNPDFVGTDLFTYTVCDDGIPAPALCDTAFVTVAILPVNDTPTINQPPLTVPEDSVITFCPAIDDADPGDVLTVSTCSTPSNGTATADAANCITYTPDPDYFGPDSVCVVVCDSSNACDSVLVPITVTPVNDPPVAADDAATTDEDVAIVVDVLTNDSDIDGALDTASLAVVSGPSNGVASVNPDGTITYTPDADYVGPDIFTYTICDDGFPLPALCDTATVVIDVLPVTDTTFVTTPEDTPLMLCADTVTNLPGPIDNQLLCGSPDNGMVASVFTPCFEYTPDPDFNGTDTFCIVSCAGGICDTTIVVVTVHPVNDGPTAVDDVASTDEDVPTTIDVVANDTDPDGSIDSTSVVILAPPVSGGTATPNPDGTVDYVPGADFVGTDVFTYLVCDDGVPAPILCDTATVTITVNPVPDTTFLTTPEETPYLVCTDSVTNLPGTIDNITICGIADDGTVTNPFNACLEYTPVANFIGVDTFCAVSCVGAICDTSIFVITVTPVPDTIPTTVEEDGMVDICTSDGLTQPPTFNTITDCSGASGTVVTGDGTADLSNYPNCITYTPNLNYVGPDTLCVVVCDTLNGLCDTTLIPITVTPVTDTVPLMTPEETPITVCSPDSLSDLGPTAQAFDCNGNGGIVQTANGSVDLTTFPDCITYTPDVNFIGLDTACVIICDAGVCDTTIYPITVTPVVDSILVVTSEDTPLPICAPDSLTDAGSPGLLTDILGNTGTVSTQHGSIDLTTYPDCILYTPDTNYVGNDSAAVVVCDDATGLCDTTYIAIVVTPVIDTVFASVPEDDTIEFCTPQQLTDVDVFNSIVSLGCDSNGTIDITYDAVTDSCISYAGEPNDNGPDTACVVICDANGVCDTTIFVIDVLTVNDPPLAVNDINNTLQNTPVTGNVLNNDIDIDGNVLSVGVNPINTTILNDVDSGTLILNTDGSYTYTPDNGFTGNDVFTYQVCDNGVPNLCDTATVVITVIEDDIYADNNPPVANDDNAVTTSDPVNLCVLCNDLDPDADSLSTPAIVTTPTNGTVALLGDSIVYTPTPGFTGQDEFPYVTCDPFNECDTATVTIDVLPEVEPGENDPPFAVDDAVGIDENEPICIDVSINDLNPDGDPLSFAPVDLPLNGVLDSFNTDGISCYVPDSGYVGPDNFTYVLCDSFDCDTATVYITVFNTNEPPLAVDDINNTLQGVPVSGDVSTNDTDPNGDDLTFTVLDDSTLTGVVTLNPDGTYDYDPGPGFTGTTFFTYVVCDDQSPAACDTAQVVISVIEDDPYADNNPPVANDDAVVTTGTDPIDVCALCNDVDPDGDSLSNPVIITPPFNGTVTVDPITGVITYDYDSIVPPNTLLDIDSFTYVICDDAGLCDTAVVDVTILPGVTPGDNQPPFAVDDAYGIFQDDTLLADASENDLNPDGDPVIITLTGTVTNGSLTLNPDGSFDYVPDPGYTGPDQFTYLLCDSGTTDCSEATVYITVFDDNVPPLAVNDINNTLVNTPVSGDVSTNDEDADGDPLTWGVVDDSTLDGSVTMADDGTYTFEPDTGFTGTTQFTYAVCDSAGLCDTAVVTIEVIPFDPVADNNPPVANDDNTVTIGDEPVDVNVTPNDFDPDGDPLTDPVIVDGPTDGTVTVDPVTGVVTYAPDSAFAGQDDFTYVVCDTAGLCDTATVTIDVLPPLDPGVSEPPFAVDDAYSVGEDDILTDDVLPNDIVPSGGPVTVSLVDDVANGTLTLNPDGTFTYDPDPNDIGPDQFVYVLCDSVGCDTATAYITVFNDNTPPVAVNDLNSTLIDVPVDGNVLTNDLDADGDDLGATVIDGPSNGTLEFEPNGAYTYSPDPGFTGVDTVTYVTCDSGDPTLCDTAIVLIDVEPFSDPDDNDPPVADDDFLVTYVDNPVTSNVLPNDYDIDGDSLTVNDVPLTDPTNGTVTLASDGAFTYTPEPGFAGVDTFTYEVCDGNGGCDTALVIIDVLPDVYGDENTPPFAGDDHGAGIGDSSIVIPILDNDHDPDGDDLTITVSDGAPNGNITIDSNGVVTYTPTDGYVGPDNFTYVICDDGDPVLCDTATVYITVYPDPNVIAVNDTTFVSANDETPVQILNNDMYPNGEIEVEIITPAAEGTATIVGTTAFYQPVPFSDPIPLDSFQYVLCVNNICDTAWVFVEIRDVEIEFTTGFSPNGDGVNDVLVFPGLQNFYSEATLAIYNRWGDQVWESHGPYKDDWDGRNYDGVRLPDGTYYYLIEFNDGVTEPVYNVVVIYRQP